MIRVSIAAFAVCVSALVAHAAVDALGDVFLARDAYDFVPHESRSMALAAALVLLGLAVFRGLTLSVDAATQGRGRAERLLREAAPRNRLLFTLGVVLCSTPMLAVMEAADVLSAGGTIDDPGDLLAGAPLFAIAVSSVIAVTVSLVVCEGFRLLFAPAILAAVAAFLRALRGGGRRGSIVQRTPLDGNFSANVLARCAGLRAPPRLSTTRG